VTRRTGKRPHPALRRMIRRRRQQMAEARGQSCLASLPAADRPDPEAPASADHGTTREGVGLKLGLPTDGPTQELRFHQIKDAEIC